MKTLKNTKNKRDRVKTTCSAPLLANTVHCSTFKYIDILVKFRNSMIDKKNKIQRINCGEVARPIKYLAIENFT